MEIPSFLPLFIAPVTFIVIILLARNNMDKQTYRLFISAFFSGLLTALPAILALFFVYEYWLTHVQSLRRIIFYSFGLIGFLSEFPKFTLLKYYYLTRDSLTKPFDGILFAIIIGLGYTTLFNLYYFFNWKFTEDHNLVMFTLPVIIFLVSIILGFFMGMSKFRKGFADDLTGLGASVILYGFYNFCLFSQDYLLLTFLFAGMLIISIILAVKSLNTSTDSFL